MKTTECCLLQFCLVFYRLMFQSIIIQPCQHTTSNYGTFTWLTQHSQHTNKHVKWNNTEQDFLFYNSFIYLLIFITTSQFAFWSDKQVWQTIPSAYYQLQSPYLTCHLTCHSEKSSITLSGSNMVFHALTFARSRGRCWKLRPEAAVFNTSLGTWRMLMHWKTMFDHYYCIKTENICYISRYFLHCFVLPFHWCLSNAISMD